MSALVEIRDLVKTFPVKSGILQRTVAHVQAVDRVTLAIDKGETLGLVGESGCGKSTLGRVLVRLLDPTAGHIYFDGEDLATLAGAGLKRLRSRVQIIFQDPYSALDPRAPVGDSIAEGLIVRGVADRDERHQRVGEMLRLVGLQPSHAQRFPHEVSGGQRQRIGIARAMLSAIPIPSPDRKAKRQVLQGDVPSPINPPSGCRFHPRCPIAAEP